LQNIAAVGDNTVRGCDFGGSANRQLDFIWDHMEHRISARFDPFEKPLFMAVDA
jgi:hypothetical protein